MPYENKRTTHNNGNYNFLDLSKDRIGWDFTEYKSSYNASRNILKFQTQNIELTTGT